MLARLFVHKRKSDSLDLSRYLGRINLPPQQKSSDFSPDTISIYRQDTNEHLG